MGSLEAKSHAIIYLLNKIIGNCPEKQFFINYIDNKFSIKL